MYGSHVDQEMYNEAVRGQSLSTKMKEAVAQNITLDNAVFYINDLIPEQQTSSLQGRNFVFIPPFVLL